MSYLEKLFYFGFKLAKIQVIRKILLVFLEKYDNPSKDVSRKIMNDFYSVKIGKYSYGCYKIDGSIAKDTEIGAFCSIAPGVRIGGMNHPTNFVSTHPFLYLKNRYFVDSDSNGIFENGNKKVVIQDDVWIGQNAVILPGIKISKGAIIGAGAVVTRDIPPYSIAVGVPAKVIKKRFGDDVIKELVKINWSEWDKSEIKTKLSSFYNVDQFINESGKMQFLTTKSDKTVR